MTHWQCDNCDITGKTPEEVKNNGCKCQRQPTAYLDPEDHTDNKTSQSRKKEKKVRKKVKGRLQGHFVESILVDGEPHFLCCDLIAGKILVKIQFETDEEIIKPIESSECGYIPYEFTNSEIEKLDSNKVSKDKLLDEIKKQIDRFLVVRDLDKNLILGNILLSYEQEHISTVHFPFFVGETESGKSSATQLFRWLAYRCLYGEDIPNADIYNFLGTDEEGAGTIAEDEAQEIERNREKIRTYKNSYAKGSLKARIITTSYSKNQVFYKTFCPKIFAGEKIPEDKGFRERLAIIHMTEGRPLSNIKRLSVEDENQLLQLRKALLVYKIQNIKNALPQINSGLIQRDQELWEDFLAVIDGTKYFEECKMTVAYYTTQRHEAIWNSLEARIFKIVKKFIDANLELRLEAFWDYLIHEQDDLAGTIEKETFYPHDYSTKVTRNYLSRLFEDKFQAKRKHSYKPDAQGKKHRISSYQFIVDVIDALVKKYNVSSDSSDNITSSGRSGASGTLDSEQADYVDHVDHSKQTKLIKEKMWYCKDHNSGPFKLSVRSESSGNIHDLHKNHGCNIEYFDEDESN